MELLLAIFEEKMAKAASMLVDDARRRTGHDRCEQATADRRYAAREDMETFFVIHTPLPCN